MRFKIAALLVVFIGAFALVPQPAHAQGFLSGLFGGGGSGGGASSGTKCGKTKTQLVECTEETGVGTIGALIKSTITVLTVLIGIVATGGIGYGALLYATARDNQSQLDQSKTIIRNIIIGLLLYLFTIAIIGWLIPGSVIDAPEPTTSPTLSPSVSVSPSTSVSPAP